MMQLPVSGLRRYWASRGPWDLRIAGLALAVCALMWAAAWERARHEHAEAVREAGKQNSNLAIALEEHTVRTLNEVEQGLTHLTRAYLAEGKRLDLQTAMQGGAVDDGLIIDSGVVDEQGLIVLSRYSTGVNIAGREQFRAHLTQPGPDMLIRTPRPGPVPGRWHIPMSKRISRADGSFAGAVYAAVNPEYFTRFYRKTELGDQGLIMLFDTHRVALARRVGDVETFGTDIRESLLVPEQARRPIGTFSGPGSDGVVRVYSYRTLNAYPLVVAVGTSLDEVLAVPRERSRYYYLAALATSLAIVLSVGAVITALTRQRRAVGELASQRTVLATVQQSLLDAVLLVDNSRRITSRNDRFIELWRVPEELASSGDDVAMLEFVTAQLRDPAAFLAKVMHLYEHKTQTSQDELHTLDGRTIDRYSAPAIGSDGIHYGRVWVFREVTQSRRAEAELRASEQRLRQLADSIGEVFWIASPDLERVIYLSSAFETVTGLSVEAVYADPGLWREAVHPDDRERTQRAFDGLAQGLNYDIDYRFRHADGRERWASSRGYPLQDATGAVIQAVGVIADITERRRATERERLAAKAFESIGDGVLVTDAARRIVFLNRAYSQISGYEPEELIGRTPRVFQSGRHDAAFYEAMWEEIHRTGYWHGEMWSRRSNGEVFPELLSISAVKDDAGATTHYVGVCTDISKVKRYEAELEYQARHDALTGLPNRVLFQDRCGVALSRARRHDQAMALLFMDLDLFKSVNDSLGHAAGDTLLQEVARRLSELMRKSDTVARFGGDEFAVLLEMIGIADVEAICKKLLGSFATPFRIAEHDLFISASIGVSLYPDDGGDTETLLMNADTALYQAKADGRNKFRFFAADMNARALENLTLTNALRLALEREELTVHYQPCVELATGQVRSAEALLRWNHPELGPVPPARFIPLAEASGLIEPIGEWVLEVACRQMRQWLDAGLTIERVAVNLSTRQFRLPDLPERIHAVLAASGLPGKHLEIEVTESMTMQDPEAAAGTLLRLKSLGVSIAIDDFGTGYSSLSYLKNLPIDFLKIDKSFVSGVPAAANDAAIVRAIVAMAKSLSIRLIAEGVETHAQHIFLAEHGCDEAQGWLFGKALPDSEVTALLAAGRALATAL
ncbi:bifunctional diguanylate cyclase/phosphodiesterase [Roseateles violae]|uniref:EAL domain-containing protein n=1 Tax=Roseateles violae TaxID=3058042 RepID=A0ABT8DVB0_9BURK|nr:EAL domain-containing protein [Pelomonas sp. PFR6]MDN3920312.1 EAL domain-containing protein [Pelomonas sp. PFR6]